MKHFNVIYVCAVAAEAIGVNMNDIMEVSRIQGTKRRLYELIVHETNKIPVRSIEVEFDEQTGQVIYYK